MRRLSNQQASIAPTDARVTMSAEISALVAAGAESLDELLDNAAEVVCGAMADGCVLGVLFGDGSRIHPLGLYHRDEHLRSKLNATSELAWERLGGVSEHVLASGTPAVLESVDLATLTRHPRLAALSASAGAHTAMVVPMRAVGTPLGVMALARTPPVPAYDEADVRFAQAVADRLALAVRVVQLREALEGTPLGEDSASGEGPLAGLTEREREIFRMIVEGLTSREVGERVFLSVRTVEWHRAHLMAKLGVFSRSELIALGHTLRP